MILIQLTKHIVNRSIRHLYWLYRLSKIKGIRNTKLHFPIICEGSGEIQIGKKCEIERGSKLLLGKRSKSCIGNNSQIKANVDLRVAEGANFTIGNNALIENNTRIFTNNSIYIEENVRIATHCAIFSRESGNDGQLFIGSGSHIGDSTIIDLTDNMHIGKNVAIGPNCTLYTHDHDYIEGSEAAWKGRLVNGPIIIDQNTWIGSNVTLLPHVHIGERSVVAAGSVVTKNIPARELWGGIPAKKIKDIKFN